MAIAVAAALAIDGRLNSLLTDAIDFKSFLDFKEKKPRAEAGSTL
jgi:hypothetical protein